MTEVNAFEELLHDIGRDSLSEAGGKGLELVEEVPARTKVHHHVVVQGVFKAIFNLNCALMLDQLQDLDLT
jgi:hypothetical protein